MLMLDHHINDGALTPRQGHEQCEGGPPYSQLKDIYLFNKDWGFFFNKSYNYKDTLHKARGIFSSPHCFPII